MIVRVHIERLVVDGDRPFTPADRSRLAAALTSELTGLLTAGGGSAPGISASRAGPSLAGPPVPAAAWSSPAALGRETARSIHRGLAQ